jgi:hypothetical protein
MHRIIRIAAVTAVLALATAGAWACGGDDDKDSLTLEQYFQRVDTIDNDSTADIDALFEAISDPTDIQGFRDAFKGLAPILQDVSDDFGDLDPPVEVEKQHDAMAKALDEWADEASNIAGDVDDIDADSPDAFFAAIDERGFGPAREKFNAACKDVQQVATDNNIDVHIDCDDEEDEAAAAEQSVRDLAAAWNAREINAFGDGFTDAGLNSVFGSEEPMSREDILASVAEDIGDGALDIREISSELTDPGADVTVLWVSGHVLEHFRFSLVLDGDDWKIDGQEELPVDVPAGLPVVNVDTDEFSFNFDAAQIEPGKRFTLQASNVGKQQHHLLMAKVPVGIDLQEALRSDEDIPGFESVGAMHPIEPGAKGTLVIEAPLEPGRYVFVCFLPDTDDPEGTPHAFKGMATDFTIQ